MSNHSSRRPARFNGLALSEDGLLCMTPVAEPDAAWPGMASGAKDDTSAADTPFDIRLAGPLAGRRIRASRRGSLSFEVSGAETILSITLPRDDGAIRHSAGITEARDLRVVHDPGMIEVFASGGATCGTRRNYRHVAPDTVRVTTDAAHMFPARHRT